MSWCFYAFIINYSKLIMTLQREHVEPSSDGSFDRLSFIVRLYPSLGGSRICATAPYAALMASMAPKGSPSKKIASGGGMGKETDSTTTCGFLIENCKPNRNSITTTNDVICKRTEIKDFTWMWYRTSSNSTEWQSRSTPLSGLATNKYRIRPRVRYKGLD